MSTITSIKSKVGEAFKRTDVEEAVIDDELRAKAEALGIKRKDIKAGGGLRRDETGASYWLPLEALIELDELDAATADNDEFWAGFADLRRRHGLVAKTKAVKWSGSSGKKDYMSNWWSGWGYSSAKSELAQRLAIALGAVGSTVSVINDSLETWRVELATDDTVELPKSYTEYATRKIVVSPQALLDTSLKEDSQIRITTGYGLHEGSHVQYSQPTNSALDQVPELSPMAVAALLHNILEDVRIEGLTSEKYPGFAEFFEEMNAYLWRRAVRTQVPTEWGPSLPEKLSAIIAICKWPTEYEELGLASELKAEFAWFRPWLADYVENRVPMRESLEKALEHLREDPATAKQMADQAKAEKAIKDLAESLAEFIKSAIRAMEDREGKPVMDSCPSPTEPAGTPSKIDARTAKEIESLIAEEFSKEEVSDPLKMANVIDGGNPPFTVTKPELQPFTRLLNSPILERMRHAFRFRKARPQYSNRLQKSGSLDEGEMWRILQPDFRVFEQIVIDEEPDTQVTLLIDASGSMRGERIKKAHELAVLIHECLRTMKGVRVRVRAHTSEVGGESPTTHIYRIWEPGDSVDRLYALLQLQMTANYDGFAIGWCAEEMLAESRPGEDMLLIVLADGQPAGGHFHYFGEPAIKHVHQVYRHFRDKGVKIVQLAVDPAIPGSVQAQMFDNDYISYVNDESLPKQMTDLLIKQFGNNE